MLLRFYCDESYDGSPPENVPSGNHEPRTYVIAGIIATEPVWENVESRWQTVNEEFEVSRFHASHLNGKTYEYEGWDDDKKVRYSARLLNVLTDQGTQLGAFTCGTLADKYREIFSNEDRLKLGDPYLMCFKACIAHLAHSLSKRRPSKDDQVAVIIDRSRFQTAAADCFYRLKDDERFPYRNLLATCTPSDSAQVIPLQAADMIAYEVFKRFHVTRKNVTAEMRTVLSILRANIGYDGGRYFSEETMRSLQPGVQAAVCAPNALVLIPPLDS